MKFFLPLFILLSFSVLTIQAQKKRNLDSLIQVYREMPNDTAKVGMLGDLYYATKNNDIEQSRKYAIERLSLAQQIDYEKGIADANYTMASYLLSQEKQDSTGIHLEKALELYSDLKNEKGKFITKNMMATLAQMKGDYAKALILYSENIKNRLAVGDSVKLAGSYIHRGKLHNNMGNHRIAYNDVLTALAIYEKIDQPLWKADALYQLGVLDGTFKNYEKAINFSLEAYKIYEEYNDKTYMGASASGIGNYYLKLKDYENAIKYLNKSIVLCEEIKLNSYVGAAKKNLGLVLIEQEQYTEGIRYLQDALRIHRKESPELQLLVTLDALGHAYNKINKPRQAIKYFDEAVALQENNALSGNPATIYEGRARALELLKDYSSALNDFRIFKSLNDSVFNSEKTKQIEELRTIYDTEKKEKQIAQQETEIALLEEKEKNTALQRTILIAGLLASLILFGLGFYGIRQKLKRNMAEKERVDTELDFKQKELTTQALHLAKKNETLENLKQKASILQTSEASQNGYQQLITAINFDLQDDNNWENFARYFEEVHKDFNSKVAKKYPEITPNELRLMSLLKMNLSTKEIANILNISIPGIKKARQRLRKKMGLLTADSLENAVLTI